VKRSFSNPQAAPANNTPESRGVKVSNHTHIARGSVVISRHM
jgi:hypothetical protein